MVNFPELIRLWEIGSLRFGLICFGLCLCTVAAASTLDHLHLVVFGPCAGPGAVVIYLALLATSTLGVIFTAAGGIQGIVRRLRQPIDPLTR